MRRVVRPTRILISNNARVTYEKIIENAVWADKLREVHPAGAARCFATIALYNIFSRERDQALDALQKGLQIHPIKLETISDTGIERWAHYQIRGFEDSDRARHFLKLLHTQYPPGNSLYELFEVAGKVI